MAGEFPLLDAGIEPVASVARARVYFKANRGDFYYYIEMSEEGGRYFGKLPRPYVEASPITYYLQATTTEFEESQTREIEAAVVKDKDDCGDREMAAIGPPGPVTVFSAASGAIGSPTGFAAAAASGILVGIITAIAVSAAAAGVVGGVVVNPQHGPDAAAPDREPHADPDAGTDPGDRRRRRSRRSGSSRAASPGGASGRRPSSGSAPAGSRCARLGPGRRDGAPA